MEQYPIETGIPFFRKHFLYRCLLIVSFKSLAHKQMKKNGNLTVVAASRRFL